MVLKLRGYGIWSKILFFFFSSRRRHTRSDRDWSSDVCSSDLLSRRQFIGGPKLAQLQGAQIRDNRPAVFGLNQRAVSAHQIFAVRNRVKYFTVSHFHDSFVVQIRDGGHVANFFGDTVAVAELAVA